MRGPGRNLRKRTAETCHLFNFAVDNPVRAGSAIVPVDGKWHQVCRRFRRCFQRGGTGDDCQQHHQADRHGYRRDDRRARKLQRSRPHAGWKYGRLGLR